MRQNEVRSLLGEPREVAGKMVWIYTPSSRSSNRRIIEPGTLTFRQEATMNKKGLLVDGDTYFLEGWEEPFWPAVERDLPEKKE